MTKSFIRYFVVTLGVAALTLTGCWNSDSSTSPEPTEKQNSPEVKTVLPDPD